MTTPTTSPTCPFCAIAATYPPSPPSPQIPTTKTSTNNPPSAHPLLSTPTVLAFLDHAPISRGHVLLATRTHREKLSDLTVEEGRAIGAWLPIVSRVVVGTVVELEGREGRVEVDDNGVGDWNVVQNNGARAAQVVPHVHFHIIPRVGDVPEVKARSWTVFGKGQREELDEEDAKVLLEGMRSALGREVQKMEARQGREAVRMLLDEGHRQGGGGSKL